MNANARSAVMWAMLLVIAASGFLGVFAIIAPYPALDERVYIGAFIAGLHALGVMVFVAIGRDQPRMTITGVSLLVLSALVFLTITVFDRSIPWEIEEFLSRSAGVLLLAALVLGHRMVVLPLLASTASVIGTVLKRTALISAPLAAGLIVFPIFSDTLDDFGEILLRLFGIALVTAACSTLALGVVALLTRTPGEDEPGLLSAKVPVELTCPRCSSKVETRSGAQSRCGSCKLRITVKIEEPRCACGYLLYQLESDTCPECGRGVDPSERWGSHNEQPEDSA